MERLVVIVVVVVVEGNRVLKTWRTFGQILFGLFFPYSR